LSNMEYPTIEQLHTKLTQGEMTAAALVAEYVSRAKASDLNAFREIFSDEDVAAQVAVAEKMLKDGTATMLTGLPIALKDNILFAGHLVGGSSKILEHYTASYDATVVEKLKAAGVVIIGRTNMDEFAMGSSTENSAYGVTKNPHDNSKVPGGSSGGSAAAVAAGLCLRRCWHVAYLWHGLSTRLDGNGLFIGRHWAFYTHHRRCRSFL
jgi:aspartyl-tRNA(Asn)/glutamyl-tRNA(Gln) amidotransferase subunit A